MLIECKVLSDKIIVSQCQGFTKISFNDIDTNVYYFFHHFLEEKEQTVSWGIRPVSLQLLIDLTLGTP